MSSSPSSKEELVENEDVRKSDVEEEEESGFDTQRLDLASQAESSSESRSGEHSQPENILNQDTGGESSSDSEQEEREKMPIDLTAAKQSIQIPKLTGDPTWLSWEQAMRNLFKLYRILPVIENEAKVSGYTDEEWADMDCVAQLKILSGLDDDHQVLVESCTLAYSAWEVLKSKY